MSKLICSSAIEGAIAWVARAEAKLDEAIAAKGESCAVGFPDTAYYLPVIYSFTGEKMQTLADLRRILRRAKELLPARPSEKRLAPLSGQHPRRRRGGAVRVRGHRGLQVPGRPKSGRWHLARRGQRRHHARARHRVCRWHGPRVCRHHRRGARPIKSRCRSPRNCRRRISTSSWAAAPTASSSPSSWPKKASSLAGTRGWCRSDATCRR